MTTERIIADLRRHPHHLSGIRAADRMEEMEAEIKELRATVRLKGALIGVAARVVAKAA